jgi:hypothetical protein
MVRKFADHQKIITADNRNKLEVYCKFTKKKKKKKLTIVNTEKFEVRKN